MKPASRSSAGSPSLLSWRALTLAAAAFALGVVLWGHFFHAYFLGQSNSLSGHLLHVGRDALLMFPVALVVFAIGLKVAHLLGIRRDSWHGLLGASSVVAIVFALSLVPGVNLHDVSHLITERSVEGAGAMGPAKANEHADDYGLEGGLSGMAFHGLKDGSINLVVALPLAILTLLLITRREAIPGQSRLRRYLIQMPRLKLSVVRGIALEELPAASITERLSKLEDPREDQRERHKLIDIIVVAICAVICGANSWVDVELFGNSKKEWLSKFLELPHGIPSHDTFGKVFAIVDAGQFQDCFMDWVRALNEVTRGQLVAIDGNTLQRSHDRFIGKAAIHLVSAWASANHLVLGQTKVDAHSSEITAIPELLKALEVSECIVTIDAMGCQKEFAGTIVEQGADYVLALKKNQGQLYEDVKGLAEYERKECFEDVDYHRTFNKGHGRTETRQCWVISDPDHVRYLDEYKDWEKLTSIVMVETERLIGEHRKVESRYYISSLPGDARTLLEVTRGHWGIENRVHWALDIAFREDESRVRKGNGAENLATLQRMALNLLKHETTSEGGVEARRKRAGWDGDYLLKVLST